MARKVLVAGTFDFLHPGHENFFAQAKAHGTTLAVVVARDETVKRIKGARPHHDENARLAAVKAHPLVDEAVLGDKADFYAAIRGQKPQVIVLGYDQWPDEEELRKKLAQIGVDAEVVRAKPHEPEKYKSSIIRKQGK